MLSAKVPNVCDAAKNQIKIVILFKMTLCHLRACLLTISPTDKTMLMRHTQPTQEQVCTTLITSHIITPFSRDGHLTQAGDDTDCYTTVVSERQHEKASPNTLLLGCSHLMWCVFLIADAALQVKRAMTRPPEPDDRHAWLSRLHDMYSVEPFSKGKRAKLSDGSLVPSAYLQKGHVQLSGTACTATIIMTSE